MGRAWPKRLTYGLIDCGSPVYPTRWLSSPAYTTRTARPETTTPKFATFFAIRSRRPPGRPAVPPVGYVAVDPAWPQAVFPRRAGRERDARLLLRAPDGDLEPDRSGACRRRVRTTNPVRSAAAAWGDLRRDGESRPTGSTWARMVAPPTSCCGGRRPTRAAAAARVSEVDALAAAVDRERDRGRGESSGSFARSGSISPPPSRARPAPRRPPGGALSPVCTSADLICATVQSGCCWRSSAAPPATGASPCSFLELARRALIGQERGRCRRQAIRLELGDGVGQRQEARDLVHVGRRPYRAGRARASGRAEAVAPKSFPAATTGTRRGGGKITCTTMSRDGSISGCQRG